MLICYHERESDDELHAKTGAVLLNRNDPSSFGSKNDQELKNFKKQHV